MNAIVRVLETSQQHRFTLEDVLRMQEAGILDESARVELIDGMLVKMAPEGTPHTRVKMQLAMRFMAMMGASVRVIIDSTLPLAPTYAPDPDLYLYDASIRLEEVTGGNVGLVIEVAQSTLKYDLTLKAEFYAQHGVREYWVIDINADTVVTHRTLAGGTYRDVVYHSARDTISAQHLPRITLCLADLPSL